MEGARGRETVLLALAWPAFGLSLMAAELAARGDLSTFSWPAFGWTLLGWLEWSLLTPIIIAVTRARAGARTLHFHIVSGVAAGLFHLLIYMAFQIAAGGETDLISLALARLPRHLTFGLLNYSAVVFAVRAID